MDEAKRKEVAKQFKFCIKLFRLKTGLTQQETADLFGVSKRTEQNWEEDIRTPAVRNAKKYSEIMRKFARERRVKND